MKWDVFISYAREDEDFAQSLAWGLERSGLRVWFDKTALQPGDSLRRSIDVGLAESEYGVIVLSDHFFAKEWPQRELDGLTAREDGRSKVVIPIWRQISADRVRAHSVTLADRLAIVSTGSMEGVITKVLRAIHRDRAGSAGWTPFPVQVPNLPELVALPLDFGGRVAVCIGRYPVTNGEYRRFTEDTGYPPPAGEAYSDARWLGPFHPWSDPQFGEADHPVVCVSMADAISFCRWTSTRDVPVFPPPAPLWDFASSGLVAGHHQPGARDIEPSRVHHSSEAPAPIDRSGGRDNVFGVSDMVGNVWEWVGGWSVRFTGIAPMVSSRRSPPELRGSSFLDDVASAPTFLPATMLDDGPNTVHSDLGFRVAALVPLKFLDSGIAASLADQPPPHSLLEVALERARHLDGTNIDLYHDW